MSPRMWIPIVLFAAGVCLIGIEVANGEAEASLVLIFPVFSGSSALFLLGTLFIVLSLITGFVLLTTDHASIEGVETGAATAERREQPKREAQYGGVVLIGPIPIAFGSNKTLALLMLVVGVVLLIVLLGTFLLLVQ